MSLAGICMLLALLGLGARAQEKAAGTPAAESARSTAQVVDGIAARIEDDIITESEVREMQAYQMLVDGKSEGRALVIQELMDQWAIQTEAANSRVPLPNADAVQAADARLAQQFGSAGEYEARLKQLDLTDSEVRKILERQIYFNRFLNARFRPTVFIEDKDIEAYYKNELAPKLEAEKQPVPPLEGVRDNIRAVLVEQEINRRAQQWLSDTRSRLHTEIFGEDWK
jgi:hypothetical protein